MYEEVGREGGKRGTYLYLYVLQLWCWWWEGGKMYVFIKRLSDMKGPGQLALWSYGKLLRNCSYGMSSTMLSGCVFLWHMVKYTFIYVPFMCGNMLTLPPIEFQSTIWIYSHLPLNIQLNGSKPTVFKLSISCGLYKMPQAHMFPIWNESWVWISWWNP